MAMLTQSLDDLIKERKTARLSGGRGGRGGKGSRGGGAAAGGRSNFRGRGGNFGGRGRVAGGGQAALRPRFSGYRVSPYANAARFQGRGRGGGRVIQRVQQRRVMPKNKVFVTNLPFDWEEGDVLVC